MAGRVYLTQDAYLHYRCDNENASVKSGGKVFCVCDEWADCNRYLAVRDKKLHAAAQKLIPYVKLGNYMWNLGRLSQPSRRRFKTVFGLEYAQYIKNGDIDSRRFDDRYWSKILCIAFPKNPLCHIRRAFYTIIAPVYKTYVRYGEKKHIIFGLCRIKKRRMPSIILDYKG